MTKITENTPLVFLLDLDQTIQGDVMNQVVEYKIIDHLNKNVNIRKYTSKTKLYQDTTTLLEDMKDGLLRPHFKRFIVKMNRRYPNCEFFIYTASEKQWANFIVKVIQDTINTKFNKRVFTRDDCVYDERTHTYMKSISHVSPDIFKALKNKYKLKGKASSYNFEHIHMVDNKNILYKPERSQLIRCKDYNKRIVIDVLRNVPKSMMENTHTLISEKLYNKTFNNLISFYRFHYDTIHEAKEHADNVNNVKYHKDKFWKKLLKKIKSQYRLI